MHTNEPCNYCIAQKMTAIPGGRVTCHTHRIRTFEILPRDRIIILQNIPMFQAVTRVLYIGCIETQAFSRQLTSMLSRSGVIMRHCISTYFEKLILKMVSKKKNSLFVRGLDIKFDLHPQNGYLYYAFFVDFLFIIGTT